MKKIRVSKLKGGEVLASDVYTDDLQVLIGKGTVLKQSYIDKLIDLGIEEVRVETGVKIQGEDADIILQDEVKNDCLVKVKDILEHHTYNNNAQLMGINVAAEEVISNILEKKEVVNKIFEIKERSADLYEHSVSVCSLATLAALKLGLSNEIVHELATASLLHDLGLRYMTVPYINVDINTLSQKEIDEYRKHTVYGYTAVQQETWISEKAKQMILFHHERIDGSGYPLHAKSITIESQILEVCEFLDENLCGIGCERGKLHDIIQYMQAMSGVLFAKEAVDSVLTFTAVYPVGTTLKLSDGRIGIVVKQNKQLVDRPVLQLLKDETGKPYKNKSMLDLSEIYNVIVDSVLD